MGMVYLNQMFFKEVARVEKDGVAGQAGQHSSLAATEWTSFAALGNLHLQQTNFGFL